jgi:hypothetical protein
VPEPRGSRRVSTTLKWYNRPTPPTHFKYFLDFFELGYFSVQRFLFLLVQLMYPSVFLLLSLLNFFDMFDHLSYSNLFNKNHIFCYDLFYC